MELEADDHERATTIAEGLRPEAHPFRGCQAMYWVDYGRALARVRGRHDDAVMALRRAEKISPRRAHRNPFAREVIAGLLARSRRDSPAGRELRRMAYRAGLPGVAQPVIPDDVPTTEHPLLLHRHDRQS